MQGIALSLCDGMACLYIALRFLDANISSYIGVENSEAAKIVAKNVEANLTSLLGDDFFDLLPGLAVTEPACCGDMKCGGSKVLKTEAHFVHMGQVSTAFRTALHCFPPSASSRRLLLCC